MDAWDPVFPVDQAGILHLTATAIQGGIPVRPNRLIQVLGVYNSETAVNHTRRGVEEVSAQSTHCCSP